MDFKSAFKSVIGKFNNSAITRSTSTYNGNSFLRFGNRSNIEADWSSIEMPQEAMYRGYSFAVIQKRGNKVASLAKTNLKTWAKPEVVDRFQDKNEQVYHPYLTLIEDSTRFSEKQFWKTISTYLDLAGRYYLGVIRTPMGNSDKMSDVKEFLMLNPYEIRRVINSKGELAGYIENKSDGRYREWPVSMIIEMRELNPFDPENGWWAMTDAAKEAVFTLQEGGNYTRQSLHGNIDAPGIITTDVILEDEDFANFRARVRDHQKGEPLFGNGAGAIKWESMQIDLDKAALMDINNMNREELFAVSGTSKTTLGIEQSGTTRETARVQNENFSSDTAQPRLEDIIDYLNLDYKKYYPENYEKTGFCIIVESAVGRDYSTENEATSVRSAQVDLAFKLIQAKYTPESAYQYAEGDITLADLELQDGFEEPDLGQGMDGGMGGNGNDEPTTPDSSDSGRIAIEETVEDTNEENKVVTNEIAPEEQGWVGATVERIEIKNRLTKGLMAQLFEGDLQEEDTNIPAEEHPHFTVMYGLTEKGMDTDLKTLCKEYVPKEVKIDSITNFDSEDKNIIVAELEKTPELEEMHNVFLAQDHYEQEFDEYRPHVTLCYINKNADPADFINVFKNLEGSTIRVTGYEIDNPWVDKNSNSFNETAEHQHIDTDENNIECSCTQKKIADFINELGGLEGDSLEAAYKTLLGEIVSIQHDAINEAVEKVTINAFREDDISTTESRLGLLKRLKEAFKKYWWFIVPLFGEKAMKSRNNEFKRRFKFVFNQALQDKLDGEIGEVAQGHLNTIMGDILDASNHAFTEIVENVAAGLIITAYRADPTQFEPYFRTEPTKAKAIAAIRNTDILEKNRQIYEKANLLAQEGYDRQDIITAIKREFNHLSTTRANTIAGNETARAFTQTQYEADFQFLTKVGKITTAYKELYSRTGDPCIYCDALIKKGPIPFTQNFLNKGESITVDENGKTRTFTANYEAISAGVVHVNCHCGYKLLLDYKPGNEE